jgi:hypothetical protein
MADFKTFNEGQDFLGEGTGVANNWHFDLGTVVVDSLTEATTYATRGAATGTGYAQQVAANPGFTNGTATFATVTWSTGANTDWPAAVYTCVASNGTVAICAWNLQAGGASRAMNAANTTENFVPTLVISG